MDRIRFALFFVVFAAGQLQAQVNRYMVFFNDKAGTPYSISSPENFLSARALQRRSNQSISVTEQDLPVTPSYVDDVQNAGATVLYRTKWMNGVLVEADASLESTLESLTCVSSVDLVAPGDRPSGGRIKFSSKFKEASETAAVTDVQLAMLGMDEMHTAGYHGEGKLVAIMDAGFPGANTVPAFQHIFNEGRFDAVTSHDFVSGSSSVFIRNSHGTHVWSIMAGFEANTFAGGAYKASYMLFITEDAGSEFRIEEYNWLFAAERADSAGADVINTSLGYNTFDDPLMNYTQSQMDGQTAVITRAANIAASKGMAIVVSAGNEGSNSWGIITAPADSENVFAVGSVNAAGVKVATSSTGPSADGRIKPDVVALGSGVSFIGSNGSVSAGGGTSYASPLVASLVAGVWQMLPELSAQALLDTIRGRASQSSNPDNLLGYGIPNFTYVITAIDPEVPSHVVAVFPNPARNQVRIEFSNNVSQLKIDLVDSKGSMSTVSVLPMSSKEFSIDLSAQKPGLYLLRMRDGNHFSVRKIIKIE